MDVDTVLKGYLSYSLGLRKYRYLIDNPKRVNLMKDYEYQKIYNGYYQVRRNREWREDYYSIFEEFKKNDTVTFEKILRALHDSLNVNRIEPSFSSKMLATINPSMPLWDSHVLEYWGLDKEWNRKHSIENAVAIYDQICAEHKAYLETKDGKEALECFDLYFPDIDGVSDVKKLDYIIWASRCVE